MNNFVKIVLSFLIIIIGGFSYTVNADGDSEGLTSGAVLEGEATTVPICANGACGAGGDSLRSGGNDAKILFNGNIEDSKKFSKYVQDFMKYLVSFITIIGVIYIIYAGLLLLTSSGEEEKMTKARKNIFYVLIGITVIYLAYPIVSWVVKAIS